jgi:hypothetical protein
LKVAHLAIGLCVVKATDEDERRMRQIAKGQQARINEKVPTTAKEQHQ